jgi:uncharacterized membrane protein YraQ (UPF0718 family)
MVNPAQLFLTSTWQLIAAMAPYLLFGFLAAGLLHWLIRPSYIQQQLGKPGFAGVVKAALLGVPLPLCSCSVIPVAGSLRNNGASRAATAAFLSSTPQTGIDSMLATYALMGGPFAIIRVGVAFLSGLLSGALINRFAPETPTFKPVSAPIFTPLKEAPAACCAKPASPDLKAGLRHGLLTLPADLAPALALGLLLAGLLTVLLPDHWLGTQINTLLAAYSFATLLSLPLYVCATASIPLAYALLMAGLSPGAALVFLIVGPATNTTTVIAAWKMLGSKATLLYLAGLLLVAWIAGAAFDALSGNWDLSGHAHAHETSLELWQHFAGALLVALLLGAWLQNRRSKKQASCCAS